MIGLSVDPTDRHEQWADDIEETQGARPNYPIIGDADFNVSKLYDMLPAATSGDPLQRTPADNATVRNVFVVGPDKKIKLILVYPMTTGRNFDEVLRVIDSLQLTAKHKVATPANWKQGDDVIIAGAVSDEEAKEIYPDGWKSPKPYIRIVPQPKGEASPDPVRLDPARTGGASIARCAAGSLRTIVALIGTFDPIGIHHDWLGAQAAGQFRDVGVARAHDVGPGRERPVARGTVRSSAPTAPRRPSPSAGRGRPRRPSRRGQLRQPPRPQVTGHGIARARC